MQHAARVDTVQSAIDVVETLVHHEELRQLKLLHHHHAEQERDDDGHATTEVVHRRSCHSLVADKQTVGVSTIRRLLLLHHKGNVWLVTEHEPQARRNDGLDLPDTVRGDDANGFVDQSQSHNELSLVLLDL